MDERFRSVAALAAANHSVISRSDLDVLGVSASLRHKWLKCGRLQKVGSASYVLAGSAPTWHSGLAAGLGDLRSGDGVIAGRAGARLHHLDGFNQDALEYLVPRRLRHRSTPGRIVSTRLPIGPRDLMRIDGLTVLRAERLILDAPLFDFSKDELENAIDSAVRLRLTSITRLQARVIERHRQGINDGRLLLEALLDSGGESGLERMFLALVRKAGLPRPETQRVYRDGSRVIARVDFLFPTGLLSRSTALNTTPAGCTLNATHSGTPS